MRTFIAIPLPEELIENIKIIQNSLRIRLNSGVSWTAPNSIHLTLKFLGEAEEKRISDIAGQLQGLCEATPPFTLKCGGLGCFPNSRQPRVIWVGIDPEKQLIDLQAQIEERCAILGFSKEERSFSPHLTLGRKKSDLVRTESEFLQGKIREQSQQNKFLINVDEVLLIKSELRNTGAIYSILYRGGLKQGTR